MKIDFTDDGTWVLPIDGTLGNKAQNLLRNTKAIKTNGLKVPRSLVIPFEYLGQTGDPEQFTLDQIDKYFPNWMKIIVRSNSPDEDVHFRFPGQYVSEEIWHKDRGYAPKLINDVLESYKKPAAQLRRETLGLEELGMCLLVQEPVENTPGLLDADYSGSFSDIGELALLTFANPSAGLRAMMVRSAERYWVDHEGNLDKEASEDKAGIGYSLRKLIKDLEKIDEKGWEIEFVQNKEGLYVVQTTPVVKKERVKIPDDADNLFDYVQILGTGEAKTDGILYVPSFTWHFHPKPLLEFDKLHKNYALVVTHPVISSNMQTKILEYLINPAVIIDVERSFFPGHPFSIHVAQYMREGRLGLAGTFKGELGEILVAWDKYDSGGRLWKTPDKERVLHSPTKLFVMSDEISQKGLVALADRQIKPFKPLAYN